MSAFGKPPERTRRDILTRHPGEYHLVAKVTGGIGQLFREIATNTVPVLQEYGFYTDHNGDFDVDDGQCILALRYKFMDILGVGQSAVVIKAQDMFNDDKPVAVKILNTAYYQLGDQETDCCLRLRAADPFGVSHVCRLLNTFSFDGHYCLVFELLHRPDWISLFHPAKSTVNTEEVYRRVRQVAVRVLQVLGFLHQQNVIHADLKPENLLLKTEGDLTSVYVSDFGNAIHCVYDEVSLYYDDFDLQTLLYRAPEVMFGLQFSQEIDVWSMGCILAELFLGRPLFYGLTKEAVIEKMVTLLGPVPRSLVQRGKFYSSLERFTFSGAQPDATSSLRSLLETGRVGKCTNYAFASFLAQILRYDPGERLSLREATCHPFLAAECGLAYLIPTTVSSSHNNVSGDEMCGYPSILLTKKSYSYKPYIDKEILRQHPSSLDLLHMGTVSSPGEGTGEGNKRRVAEVTPLGFQASQERTSKTSTNPPLTNTGTTTATSHPTNEMSATTQNDSSETAPVFPEGELSHTANLSTTTNISNTDTGPISKSKMTARTSVGRRKRTSTPGIETSKMSGTSRVRTSKASDTTGIRTSKISDTTAISTSDESDTMEITTSKMSGTSRARTSKVMDTTGIRTSKISDTTAISTSDVSDTIAIRTSKISDTTAISTSDASDTIGIRTCKMSGTSRARTSKVTGTTGIRTNKMSDTTAINTSDASDTIGIRTSNMSGTSLVRTSKALDTRGIRTSEMYENKAIITSDASGTRGIRTSKMSGTSRVRTSKPNSPASLNTQPVSPSSEQQTSRDTINSTFVILSPTKEDKRSSYKENWSELFPRDLKKWPADKHVTDVSPVSVLKTSSSASPRGRVGQSSCLTQTTLLADDCSHTDHSNSDGWPTTRKSSCNRENTKKRPVAINSGNHDSKANEISQHIGKSIKCSKPNRKKRKTVLYRAKSDHFKDVCNSSKTLSRHDHYTIQVSATESDEEGTVYSARRNAQRQSISTDFPDLGSKVTQRSLVRRESAHVPDETLEDSRSVSPVSDSSDEIIMLL